MSGVFTNLNVKILSPSLPTHKDGQIFSLFLKAPIRYTQKIKCIFTLILHPCKIVKEHNNHQLCFLTTYSTVYCDYL